ncbi:hypothetical protein CJ030_MR8G022025 [Morella rubra]|uniref:Uncharacterized protein n=1 Tax=Morella rubra TaxID=262757 RepID=A0A6A1UTY5_9ROSI|nr:hypothetical protein CJ030_MR8G022025 [Morella rubra]
MLVLREDLLKQLKASENSHMQKIVDTLKARKEIVPPESVFYPYMHPRVNLEEEEEKDLGDVDERLEGQAWFEGPLGSLIVLETEGLTQDTIEDSQKPTIIKRVSAHPHLSGLEVNLD